MGGVRKVTTPALRPLVQRYAAGSIVDLIGTNAEVGQYAVHRAQAQLRQNLGKLLEVGLAERNRQTG